MTSTTSAALSVQAKRGERRYRYYRDDLEKLLTFIVPTDTKAVRVQGEEFSAEKSDYVVMVNTINSVSDISALFDRAREALSDDGRLVLTFSNTLWRPLIVVVEKKAGMAHHTRNWFHVEDVRNLLRLADFEIVREGRRMLCPIYIPLISTAINWVGQLPLVNHLCITHFVIARKIPRERRDCSVSVVIPARNERGNIKSIIERMPSFGTSLELIFVEGNSTDGTWEETQKVIENYTGPLTVKAIQQEGRGKKKAVYQGFGMAKGEIVMILDADVTLAPEDLPKFYEVIAAGKADFANGSRLVYPMEKGAMRFLNKYGNKVFALLLSWLSGQRFKDTLCGTKALRKDHFEAIRRDGSYFGDFDSFGDFDLLFGALKRNLKIVDVPIRYRNRVYGITNILRFSHGWHLLKMCAYAAWRIKG